MVAVVFDRGTESGDVFVATCLAAVLLQAAAAAPAAPRRNVRRERIEAGARRGFIASDYVLRRQLIQLCIKHRSVVVFGDPDPTHCAQPDCTRGVSVDPAIETGYNGSCADAFSI